MSTASQRLPGWQQIAEPVRDAQLYPYLLRLALISQRQEEAISKRKQEEALNAYQDPPTTAVVSKLPKGTMKALMTYFKQLALDKQQDPVDPMLKRAYLAFYAQLLDLKSSQPDELEEIGQRAELLIVKFLSVVTKVSGSPSVESQGTQFVSLLRNIARKNGGSAVLDSQLGARQLDFQEKAPSKASKKPVKSTDFEEVSKEVARIMLVSPTLFERDLAREMNLSLEDADSALLELEDGLAAKKHPLYQPVDFESETAWNQFVAEEAQEIEGIRESLPSFSSPRSGSAANLIPEDVRRYFTSLIMRCVEADLNASTLLSHKTQRLLALVQQYWRISSSAYISCLLLAANRLFKEDVLDAKGVIDTCDYAEHLVSKSNPYWPRSDSFLAEKAAEALDETLVHRLRQHLGQMLSQKIPKLGPIIHVVDVKLPELSKLWGGRVSISNTQIQQLVQSITEAAEVEYDRLVSRLPRDSTLDVQHLLDFLQAIVSLAKSLQNKYRLLMFDQISIVRVVCAEHLKLLFTDFAPIWEFCMKQYKVRKETPPFELMNDLHDELNILNDLKVQLNLQGLETFNPESLLFPYFLNWVSESAKLSRDWVKPLIEQDTNLPIDKENGILYSTAVKDLFSSFYSSLSLVEKQQWQEGYYSARLLTITVEGISNVVCDWVAATFIRFIADLKPEKLKLKVKHKENEEQWLSYAKEATAQATAVVLAARNTQLSDPSFTFKQEAGVKLNNISTAYEMLHQMESRMNTEFISRQSRALERKRQFKQKGISYLFTLNIIKVGDVRQTEGGLYVTIVDPDSRKQMGKTSTAYWGSKPPTWNEPIELEVNLNRPKLLKAMLWCETPNGNHDLCGRAMIRLDPSQFSNREYGTQLKWIDLDSGAGRIQVLLAVDMLQDDIRFHFGKALRSLKRTRDSMISSIVEQFSEFIFALLSRQTLKEVVSPGSLANSVQSSVNQLQKSFNMWLGKAPQGKQEQVLAQDRAADDCLTPLYNYLNKNFATLAGILTPDLRKEVLSGTWDVVLEAIELLIIPPLDHRRTSQTQLSSSEMEAVYSWLSSLRDFFHSDGAGPSLERLQSQSYQQIMAIPVYYDLPTNQLKLECEKVIKSSLRAMAGNQELIARQRTVMAHRNKSMIEHQAIELHNAQRSSPQLDDVILRILRLRGELTFIEQHLKVRERLLQRELTEKALQGSFF